MLWTRHGYTNSIQVQWLVLLDFDGFNTVQSGFTQSLIVLLHGDRLRAVALWYRRLGVSEFSKISDLYT